MRRSRAVRLRIPLAFGGTRSGQREYDGDAWMSNEETIVVMNGGSKWCILTLFWAYSHSLLLVYTLH